MGGIITFADVEVSKNSQGQLGKLNLQYQRSGYKVSGKPIRQETRQINFHAVNNYGETYEDVTVNIVSGPPPIVHDGNYNTHNDVGVKYQMTGENCTAIAGLLSENDIFWSSPNPIPGLSIDLHTGYITGLVTTGGRHTMQVTCTTPFGTGTGTFTLTVVEYIYWDTGVAPNCPATPGYSGYHDHGVSVTLPDGVKSIESIENRSTIMYGARQLTFQVTGTSTYVHSYTYTPLEGDPYTKTDTCYRVVNVNGRITGGRGSSSTYNTLYRLAHFKGRVKFATVPLYEGVEPSHFYIDIDYTYDFYERPGFTYDQYGVIATYS